MAKLPENWSPGYTKRLDNWAREHGYTLQDLINSPELRKAARGHTRSEGHAPAIEKTKRGKTDILQVGRPVKDARSYRKGRTPNANDIRKMVEQVKKKNIVIYVQVISSEDSPGRRKQGEAPHRAAEWIAIRDTKQNLLEDIEALPKDASGHDLFERIFQAQRPVEAVIAWQIRELED